MSIPEPASIGHLIRQLRRRAGWSQEDLSDRSGVSARAISDLERGQRTSARFETIRMLADALDLPPEDRARLVRTAQTPMIDITLRQPRVAPSPSRALPVPPTQLIGRQREVEEIVRDLDDDRTRLITLTGPGGVGKTRLAIAAATKAAAHFPDGAAWVDLSPLRDPNAVIPAIADGLGIDQAVGQARFDALCDYLNDRRFLLVLDNFEQVIDAAPAIADLLSAEPNLTMLSTSRAPLGLHAESNYPVAPLPLPDWEDMKQGIKDVDSVRLFVERARSIQRDFALTSDNCDAVAQICLRLDGLPLAIELAASRINVLSPRTLLARLDHPLPLLTRGSRDAPERQRTMRNTIAWSYDLLDSETQWLFLRLSVFVGGFALDTVEWLTGSRDDCSTGAIDALSTLIDNNLVVRAHDSWDSDRFTMYETMREFGIAELTERGEIQEAYALLASYCRGLTHVGDGIPTCIVPEPWVTMMDAERSNIRAAYGYLASAGDPARLFEFTVAFGHYLYNRGPIDEAVSWFDRVLATSAPIPAPLRLQALYWSSHFAAHIGKSGKALHLGNEALAIAKDLGDPAWHASIVHCLGVVHENAGNYSEAEALLEQSLVLWDEAGITGLSGFALKILGVIAFLHGDVAKAGTMEDEAERIFEEMDGFAWVAMTKWLRGLFCSSEGRFSDAAGHYVESIQLAYQQRASVIYHRPLFGLAFVASQLALHETAGRLVGAAEANFEHVGSRLRGFDEHLYDLAVTTSRPAIGATAFDEARERGRAGDHAEWIADAEMIKRAASLRPLQRDREERFKLVDPAYVLSRCSAAD